MIPYLYNFRHTCFIAYLILFASCNIKIGRETPEQGFQQIFNGKDLDNWEGDHTYWKVENENLVGRTTSSTPLERNTFLIWKGGEPADFEFKGEFRITLAGNSGINYRSSELDHVNFGLKGYQADIDGKHNYTGQNYEERGRTTLAYQGEKVEIKNLSNNSEPLANKIQNNAWTERVVLRSLGTTDSLRSLLNHTDWNTIHLIVRENRLQHYVNRRLISDVIDNDTINRRTTGKLGLQIHEGPPMKVEFRNLRLKEL